MPSVIRGSDNFDTTGGNAVKAWVNFNGTGTVAIRASFNVSSITDNGTGDYTVNFTTAMTDANYAVMGVPTGSTGSQAAGVRPRVTTNEGAASNMFAESCRVISGYGNTQAAYDFGTICISFFR